MSEWGGLLEKQGRKVIRGFIGAGVVIGLVIAALVIMVFKLIF